MLHLLSTTVNPRLPLARCLRQWPAIARGLREPTRKRQRQMAKLTSSLSLC